MTYRQAHPASMFATITAEIDTGIPETVRLLPTGLVGNDDERAGQ